MNTAHGIAVDSRGEIYLADNPGAYGNQGPVARVVKFIRRCGGRKRAD